jgi:small subunit ribosomal protein S8
MSMSDPIADLLTRIRNGVMSGHETVEVPFSGIKEQICAVLQREGYIEGVKRIDDPKPGVLRIGLRYLSDRTPVLTGIRRISRSSLRVYVKSQELRPVRSGLGISIVSTSKGVMTGKQARNEKLGGEVLCEVW